MSSWKIPAVLSTAITRLSLLLDARLRDIFELVFIGVLVTRERRRTATSWFRAVRIGMAFRRAYRSIHAVGRNVEMMSTRVLLDLEQFVTVLAA